MHERHAMRPRVVAKISLLSVAALGLVALSMAWWTLALPTGAALPITYLDADRGEEVGDSDPPPLDELHAPATRATSASGAVSLDRERRTASPRG